jgi:hypothetical protein
MDKTVIIFVAIVLLIIVTFIVLLRKSNSTSPSTPSSNDKDCIVKVATPGTCTNGTYNILYDISENKVGNGKDCLTVIKDIDSKPTYTVTNNQYLGTSTCGDCVLSSISNTDCTENKQTLTLNITTSAGVVGKSCDSIIASTYPKYSYKFKKQGTSYIAADVDCSNCDISSGSVNSVCVGNRGLSTWDIVSNVNSGYGTSCSDVAAKIINPDAKYDASKNIVYYYNTNSCIVNYSGNNYYRYGFDSNNKKAIGVPNAIPTMYFYFDSQDPLTSRLIGLEINKYLVISINPDTLLKDIGDGTLITVGKDSTVYDKPSSMDFPIKLYTDQYYIILTAKWAGLDANYLSWGVSGIPLDFNFTVYDLNGNKIGENTVTYTIP